MISQNNTAIKLTEQQRIVCPAQIYYTNTLKSEVNMEGKAMPDIFCSSFVL